MALVRAVSARGVALSLVYETKNPCNSMPTRHQKCASIDPPQLRRDDVYILWCEAVYAAQNPISTSFQEEGGWYHRLGQVEKILVPRSGTLSPVL